MFSSPSVPSYIVSLFVDTSDGRLGDFCRWRRLPAIVGQWEAAQFVATIRNGVDPYGTHVNPELMPWPGYSTAFTDEELTAIYTYIRTLPIGTP